MTVGNPLQHMIRFSIPLLIGMVFQQVYSVVDTMVAGYVLGDNAIAAIGSVHFLTNLIINTAASMNNGFAIVVTQSFGSGDKERMRKSIAGQLMLNVAFDLVLTVLALVFLPQMLRFLQIPETIFRDAYDYEFILIAGMVGTIFYNMLSSVLRAVGTSRTPLYFLILCSLMNVVLDLVFVAGLNMGIKGASLATIISQVTSAVLSGIYLLKNYKEILPQKEDFRVPKELLKDLLSTGIAMALMICVVDMGSIFYSRANNALGEVYITAHSAAYKYVGILMQPIGTMATTASTFVGQNWGAGKGERIRCCFKVILIAELVYCALGIALVFLLGDPMMRILTNSANEDVIRYGVISMRAHISFFPFLGFLLPLRTSLQAMKQKMAPLISSGIEMVLKIISFCFTEPIVWVAMVSYLVIFYFINRKKIYALIGEAL